MGKLKSKRLGILVALCVALFVIVMKVLTVAEGILQNKFVLGSLIWGIVILGSVYIVAETKRPTQGNSPPADKKDE